MAPVHHDVLDALIERGLLLPTDRHRVLEHCAASGEYVEEAAVELGLIEELPLLKFLAHLHQTYFVTGQRLSKADIPRSLLEPVGDDFAWEHCLLPVKLTRGDVHVVMPHPKQSELLAELRCRTGLGVSALVARPAAIRRRLERLLEGLPPRPAMAMPPPRPARPELGILTVDVFAEWYDGLDAELALEVARATGVLQKKGAALAAPMSVSVDVALVSDTYRDTPSVGGWRPMALDQAVLERGLEKAGARRVLHAPPSAGYAIHRAMQQVRVLRVELDEHRLRVFYGVDPAGRMVLLLGGDAGEPGFYEQAIERVERLWYEYLTTERSA